MKISQHKNSKRELGATFDRARRTRGSALIAVFWLIAILSLAVFSTSWVVNADAEVVFSEKDAFRAMQLAEMGIAIAANPAVNEYDPILRQMLSDTEGFEVRIRSENGWFDINLALQSDLAGTSALEDLFTFWGLDLQDEAQPLINALKDWVDADDIPTGLSAEMGGAESEWYEEQGFVNYPFNRPFYNVEEMALCRGMNVLENYQPNWRDFFTVYSRSKVNVNEASAELIAALAKLSYAEDAQELIETRNGADGIADTEDDYQFQSVDEAMALVKGLTAPELAEERFTTQGETIRIESIGIVGEYRRRSLLILQGRESNPVILHREDAPLFP